MEKLKYTNAVTANLIIDEDEFVVGVQILKSGQPVHRLLITAQEPDATQPCTQFQRSTIDEYAIECIMCGFREEEHA